MDPTRMVPVCRRGAISERGIVPVSTEERAVKSLNSMQKDKAQTPSPSIHSPAAMPSNSTTCYYRLVQLQHFPSTKHTATRRFAGYHSPAER